jgi:pyruvate,water dikinase
MRMAERIAASLDPDRFGVTAVYVIGSSKNGTAGPASDIDLLVRFDGTGHQRADLLAWLEGWSLCLDEMNFERTGERTGGLLDVHLVTAADMAERTSYAVRIDAVTDRARPLALRRSASA